MRGEIEVIKRQSVVYLLCLKLTMLIIVPNVYDKYTF